MYRKLWHTDGRLLLDRHTTVPTDTETVCKGNTDGKLLLDRHTTVPSDTETIYTGNSGILTADCC